MIGGQSWIGAGGANLEKLLLEGLTTVRSRTVVARRFAKGYCVISDNSSRKLRDLDRTPCVPIDDPTPYISCMRVGEFAAYRRELLWI